MCTKQDQESEQGIQLPVLHTLSDHRRFVTLCKPAPYRNSLTYLLTYSALEVYLYTTMRYINRRFTYLLTYLPYLSWCQAAWEPCQEWKFFFIKHELHVNG